MSSSDEFDPISVDKAQQINAAILQPVGKPLSLSKAFSILNLSSAQIERIDADLASSLRQSAVTKFLTSDEAGDLLKFPMKHQRAPSIMQMLRLSTYVIAREFGLGNSMIFGVLYRKGRPSEVYLLDGQNRAGGIAVSGIGASMNVCFVRCENEIEMVLLAGRIDAHRKRNNIDLGDISGISKRFAGEPMFIGNDTREPRYWAKALVGASVGMVRYGLDVFGRFSSSDAQSPDRKLDIFETYYEAALAVLCLSHYGTITPKAGTRPVYNPTMQKYIKQLPIMGPAMIILHANPNKGAKFIKELTAANAPLPDGSLGGIHEFIKFGLEFSTHDTTKAGQSNQTRAIVAMGLAWRAYLTGEPLPLTKLKTEVRRHLKKNAHNLFEGLF